MRDSPATVFPRVRNGSDRDDSVSHWRLVVLGCLAGALSGVFGVGGGLVLVPGLSLLGGLTTKQSHATCIVAVAPIALVGAIGYALGGALDYPTAGLVSIGAIAGALTGPSLLARMPVRLLRVLFLVALVAVGIELATRTHAGGGRQAISIASGLILVAGGCLVGVATSSLGIGGGTILVPLLVVGFAMPALAAKGTSLAVVLVIALVGSTGHMRTRNAELRTGLIVGAYGTVTALIAGVLSMRVPDRTFRILFFVLIMLAVASTARDAVRERRMVATA